MFSLWLYGFSRVLWFPHTSQNHASRWTVSECVFTASESPPVFPGWIRIHFNPHQEKMKLNTEKEWMNMDGWNPFIGFRWLFRWTVPLNWKWIQVWDLVKQFRVIAAITLLKATTVAFWLYWELNTCSQLRNMTTAILPTSNIVLKYQWVKEKHIITIMPSAKGEFV